MNVFENVMKIVILTGTDLRHDFFRKFLGNANNIVVLRSYCEKKIDLHTIAEECDNNSFRLKHLSARDQSENDFFGLFVRFSKDNSNPVFIGNNDINKRKHIDSIIGMNPDLIISYGCSIIKGDLLNIFKGRFINVHLGLSPYYRGSGTNYWPLVNCQPELVGVTFMHIDEGIDTGEIIHQIRAKYVFSDTPTSIGNRLIIDMSYALIDIIINFKKLAKMKQPPFYRDEKIYKKRDYTEESVVKLYDNFNNNLVNNYLKHEGEECKKYPIINNKIFL